MHKPRPGQVRPYGKAPPTGQKTRHRTVKRRTEPQAEPAIAEVMRISKAMSRAGLCSRRDAERWILEGRVKINGETLTSPARDVKPGDAVFVDGQPLTRPEPAMLWRFHKPRGCVTTHKDPEGRPTVFEKLPKDLPRVVSIGRLDFNTEGLLLLTTDGGLARHFELPATGWLRRYRVRANGSVTQEELEALKDGIEIEGIQYGPIEGTVDRVQGANVWLTLGLREGKNREVRKILGSLGLEVNRLIRISFGPFQLLDLEEGAVERVKRRVLADQLGPELAKQFGLDVLLAEESNTKNTGFVSKRPVIDLDPSTKAFGSKRPLRGKTRNRDDAERDDEPAPRHYRASREERGRSPDAPRTGYVAKGTRADSHKLVDRPHPGKIRDSRDERGRMPVVTTGYISERRQTEDSEAAPKQALRQKSSGGRPERGGKTESTRSDRPRFPIRGERKPSPRPPGQRSK